MNTLLSQILSCRSLSIVGMAKNTGKTVCLNYVLDQLRMTDKVIAVTSIGVDGEKTDQVTKTEKPEVVLAKDTYFVTSEYFYRQRQLLSEICELSEETTSLGRLVTARVLQEGKAFPQLEEKEDDEAASDGGPVAQVRTCIPQTPPSPRNRPAPVRRIA